MRWRARTAALDQLGETAAPITRRQFAWITSAIRGDLRNLIAEIRAKQTPRRGAAGGCAWCGRERSLRWIACPFTWKDGSRASLCDDCNTVWQRDGADRRYHDDHERALIVQEAATGRRELGGANFGIKPFYEVAEADEQSGYPAPWSFRPAIAELREAVWFEHPAFIPSDRDDVRQRHAAAVAEAVERRRSEEVAAQAVPEGWAREVTT